MSGGKFNYVQDNLRYVVEELKDLAEGRPDEDGDTFEMGEEARELFIEAAQIVSKAAIAIHRCDWFLSYDDGEESFIERWKEEMGGGE